MSTQSTRSYIEAYKLVGKGHVEIIGDQMRCSAGQLFDQQASRGRMLKQWLQEAHLWFMMGDGSGAYIPDKHWKEPKAYHISRETYAKAINTNPIGGENHCADPYKYVFGDYEKYVKASRLCSQKERYVDRVQAACTADISGGNYLTAIPPTLILALAWRRVIDFLMFGSHRHAGFYAGLALCMHKRRYSSLWDNGTSECPADACPGHPFVPDGPYLPNNWVGQIVNAVAWFDDLYEKLVPFKSLIGDFSSAHFKAFHQDCSIPRIEDVIYDERFYMMSRNYDNFKEAKRTGEVTVPTVVETRNLVDALRYALPFVPDKDRIEEYVPTHEMKYRYKDTSRRAAPALAYRKTLAMAPTVADEIVDNLFADDHVSIGNMARLVDKFAKLKQFCMRSAVAESTIPLHMIDTQFNMWAIQTAIRPCGFYTANGGHIQGSPVQAGTYESVYYSNYLGPRDQPAYIPLRFTDYQTETFDMSPTQRMPSQAGSKALNNCMLVKHCGVDVYDDMDTDILWKCRMPYVCPSNNDADNYYGGLLRDGKVSLPQIKEATANV